MRVLITDVFAKNHRPKADREDVFDSQVPGLRLRFSKSGVRSWDYRYKSPLTGKIESTKLGSYPATGVGAARERALTALRHVEAGRDPSQEFAAEDDAGMTVAKLVDKYLTLRPNEHEHGMTSAPKVRASMARHVLPKIGGMRVIDLRQRHLNQVCEPILSAGHRHMANRITSQLKTMTRWAKRKKGFIEFDPLADAGKPAEESEPEKRTLGDPELLTFLRNLDTAITESPRQKILSAVTVRRVLLLIALTGARPGEICGMRKSEVADIGTFSMTDPLRTKNRLKHHFHLSAPAREIIAAALKDAKGSPHLFPSSGKNPHVIVPNIDNAVARAVKPSKDHPQGRFNLAPFSPHDLRRSVLNGLKKLRIAPHVVSAIASHESAFSNVTDAFYTSYRYDTERAEALELWAAHLASLIDEGKVTGLRKAA